MNKRQQDVFDLVDKMVQNNGIIDIIDKYKDDLKNYQYIETVEQFSDLLPKGSIRYINKYTGELKKGGLVIKIYQNIYNNKWYASLLIMGKKFKISFISNHIFYLDSREENMRRWADCFIADVDKGLYDIE
jgi:hypothetical protein